MRSTRALEVNLEKLEELARFYESRGFFTAATLIAAAAVEIRDKMVTRPALLEEEGNVRRID